MVFGGILAMSALILRMSPWSSTKVERWELTVTEAAKQLQEAKPQQRSIQVIPKERMHSLLPIPES
jgi:hypothetical protein